MFTDTVKINLKSIMHSLCFQIIISPIKNERHSCMIGSRMPASSVNRAIYPLYPNAVKSITLCVGWAVYGAAYINNIQSSSEYSNPFSAAQCGTRNVALGTTSVWISSTGDPVDECSYTINYK